MTPRVAIVIPVLDEAENIGDLLDDCRAQVPAADEVVVVDAGSTDGTLELLDRRAAQWPALTVLRVPGAAPGRGRNVGIRHATAEIVATLDGGSRIGPGWLAALTAAVRSDPAAVAVGVVEPEGRTSFELAAGWFTVRGFKPPDRPGPIGREFLPAGRNGLCLRREAWQAVGGYVEDISLTEDKLIVRRLREAGAKVLVATEAVVRWRARSSPLELYRQYRAYGHRDAVSGTDRQNELVPLALYSTGGWLAIRALRGDRRAARALAAAAPAYLGLFVAAAARELGPTPALAWVAPIRLVVDVAKVHGFLGGLRDRARQRGGRR